MSNKLEENELATLKLLKGLLDACPTTSSIHYPDLKLKTSLEDPDLYRSLQTLKAYGLIDYNAHSGYGIYPGAALALLHDQKGKTRFKVVCSRVGHIYENGVCVDCGDSLKDHEDTTCEGPDAGCEICI